MKGLFWDWRISSMVKSAYCSCRDLSPVPQEHPDSVLSTFLVACNSSSRGIRHLDMASTSTHAHVYIPPHRHTIFIMYYYLQNPDRIGPKLFSVILSINKQASCHKMVSDLKRNPKLLGNKFSIEMGRESVGEA